MPASADVGWDVLAGLDPGEPPPDPYALDGADPIDRVVADLRAADRAMARVLPQVDAASARDGLSVRRQVAL
ncbi:MAG TPA: hypothetical protein VMM13_08700, partial [Euzebya sp.]|nr:hypothetical protein [Euzebya sp.]